MREPKNPYQPNDTRHGAFERGAEAALSDLTRYSQIPRPTDERSAQPENCAAMRASAQTMIEMRIDMLQREIEALKQLAKFAGAIEGTPADEILWKMVANQRP